MNLKNRILTAYGTCDYLYSQNGIDARFELNTELCALKYMKSGFDRDKTEKFAEEYLLTNISPKDFFKDFLQHFDLSEFENKASLLFQDFLWVDETFMENDPKFGYKNSQLLFQIYSIVAGESESAKRFIERSLNLQDLNEKEKKEIVVQPKEKLEEYLSNLHNLIGLYSVKQEIEHLTALVKVNKIRTEKGLKTANISKHMVFLGNPGTGKTTIARILAEIYKELGVLSKGQLIETDRAGLVAGYVGQTAIQTKEVIQKALGGILFIDEAYTLAKDSKNDFGQEAIETLLKEMEDHRDDLVVIVAGYEDLMKHFLLSNPGLASRFNKYIYFEDYSLEELMAILVNMAAQQDYLIDEKAVEWISDQLKEFLKHKPANFANARSIRNYLESAIALQAYRIVHNNTLSNEDLQLLKKEDFEKVSFV